MRRLGAVMLLSVALAGCGRGVALTNASMEEVAKAMNGAARQQPGEWQTSTELVAMDLGKAANSRAAAAIQRQIGQAKVERGCVSAEQAGAPGFGKLRGGSCRFDRFVLKDGKLDARMQCTRPDAKLSMTQKGAYTGTAFDMVATLRQQGPGSAPTSMTMRLVGRRLGECR